MANQPSSSPGGPPLDIERDPLSADIHKYIESNPRLKKLAENPENRRTIFTVFQANQTILSNNDNLAVHENIWKNTFSEYGEMASDGQHFKDLIQLSPEEIKVLPLITRIELRKWKEQKNSEKEGVLKPIAGINKYLGELIIINDEAKKIVESLNFTGSDQKVISTKLQEAKAENSDNAAVAELRRKGINNAEIQSGKYDGYITASIIIEHAGELEASKDNPGFKDSIKNLISLGVPVRVKPDFDTVTKHIQERFPQGEQTNTAMASIRSGIMSGEYTGVQYDGVGNRYTLVGDKIEKSIYMQNPPMAEVRMNGLSIKYKIPPIGQYDLNRQSLENEFKENILKIKNTTDNILKTRTQPDDENQGRTQTELYNKVLDGNISIDERLDLIRGLKDFIRDRKEKNLSTMLQDGSDPEPKNSHLEAEAREIDLLEELYRKEKRLISGLQALPPPNLDQHDKTARNNLDHLTHLGYDVLGQGILNNVITIINDKKNPDVGEIDPSLNKELEDAQKRELLFVIVSLAGYNKSNSNEENTTRIDTNRRNYFDAYYKTRAPEWRNTLEDVKNACAPGGDMDTQEKLRKAIYG